MALNQYRKRKFPIAFTSNLSESSSSTPRWKYDVFLSFRGEDTRKNFVDHLYTALCQNGIDAFKDDEELGVGNEISPALLKGIEESRFAIIVFSENYASSSWCLEELVKILECKREMGQKVVPIFYRVEPSEVRHQRGNFATAFANHERDLGWQSRKVRRWRAALKEAANITGCDTQITANGYESQCIQRIVRDVLREGSTFSRIDKNLVGMESRVAEVKSLLSIGLDDVRIIGIWGMGGIGKTTIAKAVFDQISYQFEGKSFLENVREVSMKHGVDHLQKKLLDDILMMESVNTSNVYRGINVMKNRLHYKRVIVVLDDVDHVDQIDKLVGEHNCFDLGSRIIITARDKHLLSLRVDEIYEVNMLNKDEAILLLSRNAFKMDYPTKGYEELSYHVVHYAGGLPLALKVWGCFLFGRDMVEWRSAVNRLKEIPEKEILEKLRISFDGLKDIEKEIFLDIACFFKGKEIDFVVRILNSFDFHANIGISVLIEKGLIVDSDNRLEMHDLIQDMGWHIVWEQSPIEPERRSRLWHPEDVFLVLKKNLGTKSIEGIMLDLRTPKDVNFNTGAFKEMDKLRLLIFNSVNISQGPDHLPNNLRYLHWHAYPSKSLPASFQPKKLVELIMLYSRMVQPWKGVKKMDRLKVINLGSSEKLTRTPDFTGAPNLETLILQFCTSLVEVHPSIGFLEKLTFLNLSWCTSLKSLCSIQLKSLEILDLSFCKKLENFPEILGEMECLSKLYLDQTAIKELPTSIEHLSSLSLIILRECKNLTSLPNSICSLKCLQTLILSGCSKLDQLPENLGNIECLEELLLDGTAIKQPPSSIVRLKNLKILSFHGCKGVASQSQSSFFSSWLLPRKSKDSMSLVLPSVLGLCSLKVLNLSDCNLSDGTLPSNLGCLSFLEELNLSRNNFVNLPESINQLSRLGILELVGCKRLEALPKLPSSVAELYTDDCVSLKCLGDLLTKCKMLWTISVSNCFKLVENQRNDNMADALWQCLLQGLSLIDDTFSIVIPGREIPKWFSNQSIGPLISIKLPPYWYNDKFMGFALCVVSGSISPSTLSLLYLKKTPCISIHIRLTTHDHRENTLDTSINQMGTYKKVDSEHVCLAYIPFVLLWSIFESKVDSPNDWCEFEVSSLHMVYEESVSEKWGVRLVYHEDVKMKNQTMMIDGSPSGKTGLFNADFDGSRYTYKIRDDAMGYFSRLPTIK